MHSILNEAAGFLARNWQELAGFVTGALCVWLLIKQNIWNWPIGIANNVVYVIVFYHSGLYADSGLQFVYMAISFYGWWNWLHGGVDHSSLKVNYASPKAQLGYVALAAATTGILYWILRHTPSNVPFFDGLTTALFLTAQYMMSRKLVENWWFWIVGDVLVIGLYIYKHLYLTSALYAVFLAMCISGLLEWRRSFTAKPEPAVATA